MRKIQKKNLISYQFNYDPQIFVSSMLYHTKDKKKSKCTFQLQVLSFELLIRQVFLKYFFLLH